MYKLMDNIDKKENRAMRDLIATITRKLDFSGLKFYVQGGDYFDIDLFCQHNNLDSAEIDNDDITALELLIANTANKKWILIDYKVKGE